MKIYTKTGDKGQTSLYGGKKVLKSSRRIHLYGTLDETNCILGMCVAQGGTSDIVRARLLRLQRELFTLGSELASPGNTPKQLQLIGKKEIDLLESEIDEMESKLPQLKNFVLPGGSPAGAILHLARAVLRRAERIAVALNKREPVRPEILIFLNRGSDYLFVLSRYVNQSQYCEDVIWKGQ